MSYARKGPALPTPRNEVALARSGVRSAFSPGGRLVVGREPETKPQVKASKNARELARKRGIDLGKVQGTGPEGAITIEDVRRFSGGQ